MNRAEKLAKAAAAEQLQKLGDEFRDLVLTRTGLTARTLVCPREKSDMTPCVARDGGICVIEIHAAGGGGPYPVCVGCETRIDLRLAEERARA